MVALRVFTLCDYASTRNNLLTIVGGGVTNLWAPQIPTAPNLWVGVLLEIGPDEAQTPHEVRLTVTSVDNATAIAPPMTGRIDVHNGHTMREAAQIPLAFDLRGMHISDYGRYDVRLTIDQTVDEILTLTVSPQGET